MARGGVSAGGRAGSLHRADSGSSSLRSEAVTGAPPKAALLQALPPAEAWTAEPPPHRPSLPAVAGRAVQTGRGAHRNGHGHATGALTQNWAHDALPANLCVLTKQHPPERHLSLRRGTVTGGSGPLGPHRPIAAAVDLPVAPPCENLRVALPQGDTVSPSPQTPTDGEGSFPLTFLSVSRGKFLKVKEAAPLKLRFCSEYWTDQKPRVSLVTYPTG